MRRNYFYLSGIRLFKGRIYWLILFSLMCIHTTGQVFQPHTDNVFVNPGGSARWNVLSNDELGTNHWSEVTVDITTYPHHAVAGSVWVESQMNLIRYTPVDGFWGRDSLQYSVYAPKLGETKTAWVYINVTSQPDNLYTDMCTSTAPPQRWGISGTRSDEITLSPYQNAITGDIDGDGIVEILVCMNPFNGTDNGIYRPVNEIAIYKGNDITAPPRIITTEKPYCWDLNTRYAIVKTQLNGRDSTLIVVAETDRYIRAYSHTGEHVWTSSHMYHPSLSTAYYSAFVSFADLNHDGIPEVLVNGKIFDSRTGQLLCETPYEPPSTRNQGTAVAVDLYHTGTMNLIVGNYIYEVDAALTTLTQIKEITPLVNAADPDAPATLPTISPSVGGLVSAVDIDNDGKLDLVIRYVSTADLYTLLYVVDPETGAIKASKYIPQAGVSGYPFVGDIDGDGFPEIVLIKNQTTSTTTSDIRLIIAYKYEAGNPVLQEFWRLEHTDNSGATGITLFDFNQDGISELVYRDETHLRIINGSLKSHITGNDTTTVYNLATIENKSGTGTEYPVIADVDGDGQAEILIVGAHSEVPGTSNPYGCLWVYKSEFPEESPWAPARKVWNQYAFNPVNINEDLTVPRYPLSPATEFITKTGKRHRPYNNFLQQATHLNDEGEPLHLAADISFVFGYPASTIYVQPLGEVQVSIFVVNEGNANTSSPLYVSVYAVKDDDTYVYLHTEEVDTILQPNEQLQIEFSFPYTPQNDHKGFELRLNEKEGIFLFDECLTSNNYARGKMFSPDERIICEGDTELIELSPQGVYWYQWFTYDENSGLYNGPIPENTWINTSGGGFRIGTNGETLEITKNGDIKETFYLLLYDLSGDPLSINFDSLCIYLSPDTLVWTGAESADWHNPANWQDPTEADPLNPVFASSKVPRKCTNVLIPDGLLVYPDLSPLSTTYYYYQKSECANITFEHGGEVIRTDTLDYDAAYIHQQLVSNRWYMLSPPLGDFYPGDYYIHDPNPINDDVYIYTAFFGRSNPETSAYIEGEWTGTFNTPGIRFSTGTGFAVWVDDKQPDATLHTPFDFYFPKYDTYYHLYSWQGNPLMTHPVERGWHHRFVYEQSGGWDPDTGEITLPVAAQAADVKVIVGNPFMSHWNFSAFQAANPIKNYYQVLDGDGQNFSTYIQYGTGATNDPSITITTANPVLDEYIAPMQSIIVESTTAFPSLSTHVTHVTASAGAKLRSASDTKVFPLYIDAEINGNSNRTVVLLDPDNTLYGQNNIAKILLKENLSFRMDEQGNILTGYPYPVSIYSLSEDGMLLDVQTTSGENALVPIGVSTLQKGTVRLSFEGISGISSFWDVYLVDKKGGIFTQPVNLSEQPWYEFEKEDDEAFLNERFYLKFTMSGTSLEELPGTENNIRLYRMGNALQLVSENGENIEEVVVSDLQGHVLFRSHSCAGREVILQPEVAAQGFYLVRCNTRTGNRVFKIHY